MNRSPQLRYGKTGLVLEIECDKSGLVVDPRDFLASAFAMWDCRSEKHSGKQADVLSHVFGEAVLGYFEEATRTSDREDRSQLFQLSCCDRRVVDAHLDNEIVLLGRGKTAFKSACLAPVPIWPERIGKAYSKPTIRKAVQDCMAGAYENRRMYIISEPDEQFLDGLSAALKEERLTVYAVPEEEDIGKRGFLLGAITDAIRETFEVILRWGPLTTGDLAKSLDTSPQNAKNRVDRLVKKKLATREKVPDDTGGKVWLNRIQ
jgi:hypothetical protein